MDPFQWPPLKNNEGKAYKQQKFSHAGSKMAKISNCVFINGACACPQQIQILLYGVHAWSLTCLLTPHHLQGCKEHWAQKSDRQAPPLVWMAQRKVDHTRVHNQVPRYQCWYLCVRERSANLYSWKLHYSNYNNILCRLCMLLSMAENIHINAEHESFYDH